MKRHLVVDTCGWLVAVVVHAANVQDRDGAKLVLAKAKAKGCHVRLRLLWADGGYAGKLLAWVTSFCHWTLQVVKRSEAAAGFVLLPRRWVVERTFGWLSNCRRLSRHYEYWNETGEAFVQAAMIRLMARRLAAKGTKSAA